MTEAQKTHITLAGTTDYINALDELCGMASRTLFIFENDYDNLGFNSEARYQKLHHFLLSSPNAQLHLLAHNTQLIVRFCPRLMMLLRQFGHNMKIFQTPMHLKSWSEPFSVADEMHFVRRFHFDDARGIFAKDDHENARVLKAQFEEMWTSSHASVSPSILGL